MSEEICLLRYIRGRHCQAVWSSDVLPAQIPFRRTPLGARSPLMLDLVTFHRLDQPVAVSIAEFVLVNDVYRHLEARLDLSFVREWATEHYTEPGRPSIEP